MVCSVLFRTFVNLLSGICLRAGSGKGTRTFGMKNTFLWCIPVGYAAVLFVLYHECAASHVYYAYSAYLHAAAFLLAFFVPAGWKQWRIFMFGLVALGFVLHLRNVDKPGIRTVDIGSVQVLKPTPESPDDYMERTLFDGTEYKGQARFFKDGLFRRLDFDGAVKVRWANGDCLDGWYEKGKLKSGRLVLKEEHYVYDGELSERVARPRAYWLHGQGVLYTDSARCYAGFFSHGCWVGQGIIYGNFGKRRYESKYENNGYGSFLLPARDTYVGRFRKGTLTGFGRFYYKDGGYYQGFFKDGKFTWTGSLYGADGKLICVGLGQDVHPLRLPDELSGKLAASQGKDDEGKASSSSVVGKNGKSQPRDAAARKDVRKVINTIPIKYVAADTESAGLDAAESRNASSGRRNKSMRVSHDEFHPLADPPVRKIVKYDCKVVNRCMEGEGTALFDNGDVYMGDWHRGLRHGHGKMNYANGDICDGDWVNGRHTGPGVYLTAGRQRYKGDFVDGELHGIAVHYDDPTRKIIYNGRWEHGKSVPLPKPK